MEKVFAIVLCLSILLCGCGAKSEAGFNAADRLYAESFSEGIYGYPNEAPSMDNSKVESGLTVEAPTNGGVQNQKLIRTVSLDVETNALEDLLAQVESKIQALGGYVENKSVRNGSSRRYASLTIRIPVPQLDSFIEHVSGASNIISHSENAKDITLSYVATQSRITALETEQIRLLELLAQAENMSDLLLIEERLTNVRTELEQVTSQLRLYDNLVDYGTINLSISEVKEYTETEEKTFLERIGSGFVESVKNMGIFLRELVVVLITAIPYLLIPAIFVIGLVAGIRRKARAKKAPPAPKAEDAP